MFKVWETLEITLKKTQQYSMDKLDLVDDHNNS